MSIVRAHRAGDGRGLEQSGEDRARIFDTLLLVFALIYDTRSIVVAQARVAPRHRSERVAAARPAARLDVLAAIATE